MLGHAPAQGEPIAYLAAAFLLLCILRPAGDGGEVVPEAGVIEPFVDEQRILYGLGQGHWRLGVNRRRGGTLRREIKISQIMQRLSAVGPLAKGLQRRP